MCLAPAASGGRSPRTCRRAQRCTIISICGAGTARSTASMRRFTGAVVRRPPAKRARPPPSSTARASRARKRGGLHRSARLRCRQEDQGQEAARSCRYARPPDARDRDSADIQDRDGGALLMASLFGAFPFLVKLYADGGYQGPEFQRAMKRILARVDLEIVKRLGHAKGFVVLPKRWIVERTLAWLGRCRRLAKDWECLNRKALAFLRLASIRLMLRKLCNPA